MGNVKKVYKAYIKCTKRLHSMYERKYLKLERKMLKLSIRLDKLQKEMLPLETILRTHDPNYFGDMDETL